MVLQPNLWQAMVFLHQGIQVGCAAVETHGYAHPALVHGVLVVQDACQSLEEAVHGSRCLGRDQHLLYRSSHLQGRLKLWKQGPDRRVSNPCCHRIISWTMPCKCMITYDLGPPASPVLQMLLAWVMYSKSRNCNRPMNSLQNAFGPDKSEDRGLLATLL